MDVLDQAIDRYARAHTLPVHKVHELLARLLESETTGVDLTPAEQQTLDRAHAGIGEVDERLRPWLSAEAAFADMSATAVPLATASKLLDITDGAIRQVIGSRPAAELLGVKTSQGWRVFTYQLPAPAGIGSEPASRVGRRVQRGLPPDMHPVAVARWWDTPNEALYLQGEVLTPRDWVDRGYNPDVLITAAEHEDAG